MSTSPFSYSNVHPNSIEAFKDLDLAKRQAVVLDVFQRRGKSMTDREVLFKLTGDFGGDLNKVQPRITEMKKDPNNPLREVGKTVCSYSNKRVRVCMIDWGTPQMDLFGFLKGASQ